MMIKKIIKNLIKLHCIFKIRFKRLFYQQLFILISTPFYGNVGDHAILLQEIEILKSCGINRQIIDFSSYEYKLISHIISKYISSEDIIIIDGGGNFGDTWPETTYQIINIIKKYKRNTILIFPESWYYSNSFNGNRVLKDTQEAFSQNRNVVMYARDSWSLNNMIQNLPQTVIKYSYDTVLLGGIKASKKKSSNKSEKTRIGICIRDDKESKNFRTNSQIRKLLSHKDVLIENINNDSYKHIAKIKRKHYVNSIIKKYEKCDLIITDRFHGFIFSLLLRKPCVIIDNSTGKIHHFYSDIKQYICGYYYIDNSSSVEEILNYALQFSKIKYDNKFAKNILEYREDIKKRITQWRKYK